MIKQGVAWLKKDKKEHIPHIKVGYNKKKV
jgi:hypothetical protein